MRSSRRETYRSHLPASADHNIHIGNILTAISCLGVLHLPNDIHAVKDFAKHNVLTVKEGCGNGGDEELGAITIGACVLCTC
jgi:hypothetical protein